MEAAVLIKQWYGRAQIDYYKQYVSLYASFNAWYRTTTRTSNDRQALNILCGGCVLWDDYCQGKTMRSLGQYMQLLVEYTQREPISHATPHWKGELKDGRDWASLVEYWYRVRCLVAHGVYVGHPYVHLAYETLNIFMGEVIRRLDLGITVYK